jgi:hypothetical protein
MNGNAGLSPGTDGCVDQRIMRDHRNVILRNSDIEFEHVDALLNGIAECRQGVLRTSGTGSAVAMNEDARAIRSPQLRHGGQSRCCKRAPRESCSVEPVWLGVDFVAHRKSFSR